MLIADASLINFTTISLYVNDIYNFDIKKLTVKNDDRTLYISDYKLNNSNLFVVCQTEVDIKRLTTLFYKDELLTVSYLPLYSSKEFDERYYTDTPLGINYSKEFTEFYLWSPVARYVNLCIFESGDIAVKEKPKKFKMLEKNGIWHVKVKGNLRGYYYTYELKIYDKVNEVIDPYARLTGVNGLRGAIANLKDAVPKGFDCDVSPTTKNPTDAIIYEISIRDISVHPDSNIVHKGKYLGLTEEETFSSKGVSTGLQHIKDLGVTHLQIMPMFDFSYASIDEKNTYKYNWGYDPQNYNVPEGSYSTNPYYQVCRSYELKQMILKLHKSGFNVVMDVVYNHVFNHEKHPFENIFPGYYFRYDAWGGLSNGSGCGNDIASERSMVRKYIVDSILFWAKEYHIDGFRFDLMGILDITTMNEIKNKLLEFNKNILLYGEGWSLGTHLPEDEKATLRNAYKLPGIGYFNDVIRDCVKGSVFNVFDMGFVSGKDHMEDTIKTCVRGCTRSLPYNHSPLFFSPCQSINYVSCHDNLTLWDKLKVSCPYSSEEDLKAMHILADGIILTCQGIPFIHGGADFCRTKNGIENSYNSTDTINRLDWNRKLKYKDVFDYYAGLITLRKEHPAFRLNKTELIEKHLSFIDNVPAHSVAFKLSDHANDDTWKNIMVIYNANKHSINIPLPQATWNLVVNRSHAGVASLRCFTGDYIEVEPISITVLYSEN
jgi:pullulanase